MRFNRFIAVCGILFALAACGKDKTTSADLADGEPSAAAPSTSESSPPVADLSGDECPILSSTDLDAIVGVRLTDHYELTKQPGTDSPLAGSVLCDFANSAENETAKIASGEITKVGTVEKLLQKLSESMGVSLDQCPAISGVGDRAFSCSEDQAAIVVAQDGDQVVMAYRGGHQGSSELVNQASAIAKAILAG